MCVFLHTGTLSTLTDSGGQLSRAGGEGETGCCGVERAAAVEYANVRKFRSPQHTTRMVFSLVLLLLQVK